MARVGGVARKLAAPSTRLALFVGGLALLGASLAVVAATRTPWELAFARQFLWSVVILMVAAVVGELRPVAIPRKGAEVITLSMSTPFVLALVAVGGVGVALVTQVIASGIDDVIQRRSLLKSMFNTGQYVTSVIAGGAVYASMTRTPLFAGASRMGADHVLPLIVAGAVMISVNTVLVAIVVALATGQRLSATLAEGSRDFGATLIVLLSVGAIAAVIAGVGAGALLLLAAPVVAAHLFTAGAARHAHDAAHDSLTGLGNRSQLHFELERSIEGANHGELGGPALILLDLDHFKDINDTLGHPVGDQILRHVAGRLAEAVPEGATVHRLGGDEFAVVVQGGPASSKVIARSLLATFDQPVPVDSLELLVRASAGLAIAPLHGTDVQTLMKNADIALYHAKLERDRVSVFAPELDVNSVDRLQLLTDLRHAIETRRLHLAFQPQYDLSTGLIVGAEALVRWQHPERGPMRADEFIMLAENSGLIFPLTAFVLDDAVGQLATWRAQGHDLRMAVNISARHLSDLSLPDQVRSVAELHGVPLSSLVLEVTETAILSDPVRADIVLRTLRNRGVEISIDDYGTGQASLSYLKKLEIDELKIDRSFVSAIHADNHDLIIVRSTVELALALGLRVVAEGIEDQETALALQTLGDVIGQGYHLARPMPASTLSELLAEQRVRERNNVREHEAGRRGDRAGDPGRALEWGGAQGPSNGGAAAAEES